MLAKVLEDGTSYGEAGAPYGLGRSTVERTIKALVLQVAREQGIPAVDEDALISLTRLRQFREPVLQAGDLDRLGSGAEQHEDQRHVAVRIFAALAHAAGAGRDLFGPEVG